MRGIGGKFPRWAKVDGGEIGNGIVVRSIAGAANQNDARVACVFESLGLAKVLDPLDDLVVFVGRWLLNPLGGHFHRAEPLGDEGPAGMVASDVSNGGVLVEVELRGWIRRAVAGEAVGGEERADGFGKLMVEFGCRGVGCEGGREKTQKHDSGGTQSSRGMRVNNYHVTILVDTRRTSWTPVHTNGKPRPRLHRNRFRHHQ